MCRRKSVNSYTERLLGEDEGAHEWSALIGLSIPTAGVRKSRTAPGQLILERRTAKKSASAPLRKVFDSHRVNWPRAPLPEARSSGHALCLSENCVLSIDDALQLDVKKKCAPGDLRCALEASAESRASQSPAERDGGAGPEMSRHMTRAASAAAIESGTLADFANRGGECGPLIYGGFHPAELKRRPERVDASSLDMRDAATTTVLRLEQGPLASDMASSPEDPLAPSERMPNGLTYQATQSGLKVTVHENPLSTVLEYRRTPSPVTPYQDASRPDAVLSLPIRDALSSKKPSRDESCVSFGVHRPSDAKPIGAAPSPGGQRARDLSLLAFVTLLAAACCVLAYLAFVAPRAPPDRIVFQASSLLNGMDQSADPCSDFFQYACGSWNKRHQIPEDRPSISTFEVLSDELQIILKDVIEDIGDQPLRAVLRSLGGWPVTEPNWTAPPWGVERLLGDLRGRFDQGVVVEQWVGPDDKNSSVNIIQIDQQLAFGLPSREYYLKESSEKDRRAYHRLMVEVAQLLGAEPRDAHVQMDHVLALETKLANISVPEADRHDTGSIYNKMTLRALSEMVPVFNWSEYLSVFLPVEVSPDEPLVVYSVPYLRQVGQILVDTDQRTLHNFAVWRLVNYLLAYLDGDWPTRRWAWPSAPSSYATTSTRTARRPRWR
ncbi:hypothetical protein MRX96_003837 [Rhipicephalus microplus]